MPKHSGLLDINPDAGLETWFHREHDGSWVHQTIQDVEPILEANKWNQNHNHMTGAFRRVASIPLIFIEKWKRELGIDYWLPDHQEAVDRLLDDPEWMWLRTDDSTLSKRSASKQQIESRITARQLLARDGDA